MVTLFSRCAVVHKSLAGHIVRHFSFATVQACSIENKLVSSQLENNLQVKCAWQRRWKQRSCHCKFLDHTSWSTVRGVGYRNPRSGLAVMAVALWNDFEICEIKLYVELWSKSCRSKPTVARLCLRCCALQAKVQSLLELVKIRACRIFDKSAGAKDFFAASVFASSLQNYWCKRDFSVSINKLWNVCSVSPVLSGHAGIAERIPLNKGL